MVLVFPPTAVAVATISRVPSASSPRLPLEDDGNGVELKSISDVVLLGESAGDRRLHDVLKEVLGEQLVTAVSDRHGRNTGNNIIDPLFAASRGVAWDCWGRMNFDYRQ